MNWARVFVFKGADYASAVDSRATQAMPHGIAMEPSLLFFAGFFGGFDAQLFEFAVQMRALDTDFVCKV